MNKDYNIVMIWMLVLVSILHSINSQIDYHRIEKLEKQVSELMRKK